MPALDDVEVGLDARHGVDRGEQAEQRQDGRHHQAEQVAPFGVAVGHGRREGDHQERLRGQVGAGAFGQQAGLEVDFGAVEQQALLGRLEELAALGVLIQQQGAQVGHAGSVSSVNGGCCM